MLRRLNNRFESQIPATSKRLVLWLNSVCFYAPDSYLSIEAKKMVGILMETVQRDGIFILAPLTKHHTAAALIIVRGHDWWRLLHDAWLNLELKFILRQEKILKLGILMGRTRKYPPFQRPIRCRVWVFSCWHGALVHNMEYTTWRCNVLFKILIVELAIGFYMRWLLEIPFHTWVHMHPVF